MGNFLDAVRTLSRPPVRSWYYVTGTESVLVEEVADRVRSAVAAAPENVVSLSAITNSTAECWDAIASYGAERRLVVIRDAHKLTGWNRWAGMAEAISKRVGPQITVLYLAAAPDFGEVTKSCTRGHTQPTVEREIRKRMLRVCLGCDALRKQLVKSSTSLYVECNPPTEEAALKVLCGSEPDGWTGWAPGTPRSEAKAVLAYLGGDLRAVRDVATKARLVGQALTPELAAAVAGRGAGDDFAMALTERDVATAVTVARDLSKTDLRRAVGLLESNLLVLRKINRVLKKDESTRALSTKIGVPYIRVVGLRKAASKYSRTRTEVAWQALCMADAALAGGEYEGVAEMLALQW